ncbi:hypothetical protein BaRGS_00005196 [Batillaria attramentaria]|uniref:Uncharacterized protein n=1 Tax=Batillaria attramentaria TaxID=370345 RepID=A0ABD0LVW1_9CAEN
MLEEGVACACVFCLGLNFASIALKFRSDLTDIATYYVVHTQKNSTLRPAEEHFNGFAGSMSFGCPSPAAGRRALCSNNWIVFLAVLANECAFDIHISAVRSADVPADLPAARSAIRLFLSNVR